MSQKQNQTSDVVEEVKNKLQKYQKVLGIEEVFNTNSPHQLRFQVVFKSLTGYQMKAIEVATRIEILSIEPTDLAPQSKMPYYALKVLVEVDKTDLTSFLGEL